MKILGIIVAVVVILFVLSIVFAFPIMWLWNWLCPVVFGLPEITVWQALGLNMLFGLLLRSSSFSSKS